MTDTLTTLATLTANIAAPAVDMEDLRLNPDACMVDEDDDVLMLMREHDGQRSWTMQNVAGRQRSITEQTAHYATPYHGLPPIIRVFLSSTFRDMAVERNHLIQTVFPRLKRLALAHGITVQEIDLRWGVTEEQVHRGETVAICLDEIDRCRGYPPFFIGMLGERYGWVPDTDAMEALAHHLAGREKSEALCRCAREQGMSVTEMEIRYGVLDQPQARRHAFFYNRAPELTALLASQPGANILQFYDPEYDQQQAKLKSELARHGLLRLDGYRSVLELGEDIERLLSAAIVRLARSQLRVTMQTASPMPEGFDVNQDIGEALRNEHLPLQRDNQLDWDDHWRWLRQKALAPRLLLLGPAGMGKRTHVQAKVMALTLPFANTALHCRTGYVHDTESACHYLRTVLSGRELLPPWKGPARLGFRDALERISSRFMLVITDIDLLEDGAELVELLGLVGNPALCIVLTASDASLAGVTGAFTVRHLGELSREDRLNFIDGYLQRYRKTLSVDSAAQLADLQLAGSPTVLRLMLEELRRDATFESLPALIATYAACSNQEAAYRHALATWLRHVDPAQAQAARWQHALAALCIAQHGVPEAFFTAEDGSGLPPLSWASWLGLASPVMQAVGLGWQLSDPVSRRVIAQHYADAKARLRARRLLACHLQNSGVQPAMVLAEISHQLLAIAQASDEPDDITRLHQWLLTPGTMNTITAILPELASNVCRYLLQQGVPLDTLIASTATSQQEIARWIPLLSELAAWPLLEQLMRLTLTYPEAGHNVEFVAQLAIAVWLQGRPAEAAALLAPSLQAWMVTPDQPPPDTLGPLMSMAVDGDILIAEWTATLETGLLAVVRSSAENAAPVPIRVVISALALANVCSSPQVVQSIALQCLTHSYDFPGQHALDMRLMAVEAIIIGYNKLGQYAEAVDFGREFIDVNRRDSGLSATHGSCGRLMACSLVELQRWDEALTALEFARDYELPYTQDPLVGMSIGGLLATCLARCDRAAETAPCISLFLNHAAANPALARILGSLLSDSLRLAGMTSVAEQVQSDLSQCLPLP